MTTTLPEVELAPDREGFSLVLGGDSMMEAVYPALEAALERSAPFEVAVDWRLTAALTDVPDAQLLWERVVAEDEPDAAVFMLGWWENVRLQSDRLSVSPRTDGWTDEYADAVARPWKNLLTDGGADFIWLTSPPMVSQNRTTELAELDAAWRSVAEEPVDSASRRGSMFVLDTTEALDAGAGFVSVLNEEGEPPVRLRSLDGINLCPDGVTRVVEELLLLLRERYGLVDVAGWEDGAWRSHPTFDPAECPAPE